MNWLTGVLKRAWLRVFSDPKKHIILTTVPAGPAILGGTSVEYVVPSGSKNVLDLTAGAPLVGCAVGVEVECLDCTGFTVLAGPNQPPDEPAPQAEIDAVVAALASFGIAPTLNQLNALVSATRIEAVNYLIDQLRGR